jgi:pimeloyl-ACP methyl ester carboxylesterase
MSRDDATATPNWADIFYTSQDGLKLYARRYGDASAPRRPIVCLSGLTRNSRDFHSVATALSGGLGPARAVYCLDYRGRGFSEYDPNWRNYSPFIELLDVLDFMTIHGLSDAGIVGTSRGGIIAMLMAVMRPSAIGAAVLNDIGPVIETAGLARIMGYAGKIPLPYTWEEAAALARDMNKRFFTQVEPDEWMELARQWFNEHDGRPAPGYDVNLAKALEEIDVSKKIPEMWPHFQALSRVPVLALRGENSDLLSTRTLGEMQSRNPKMAAVTVRGHGHAPLLRDRFTQRIIADFFADADR